MIKKILVPIKFTIESVQAIKYAVELAKEKKAKITLLHVMPGTKNTSIPEQLFSDDELRRKAELRLSKVAKDIIHHNNIDYEIIISKGNETEKIIEFAKKFNMNYLILRKSIPDTLLGTVEMALHSHLLDDTRMKQKDIYAYFLKN